MGKRTRNRPLPEQIKERAEREEVEEEFRGYAPTGSTLLNLALSDDPDGGFALGKMVNIIGDRSSGKTALALSLLAEASQIQSLKDHRFIFDDTEASLEFDLERLFGSGIAERMEPPGFDEDEEPLASSTIQDFRRNVFKAIKEGVPFIYILDSFDALTSEEEEERTKADEEGKEVGGTFGVEKPKIGGSILRQIVRKVKKTNSLLIIISQTRDNINPRSFTKKTRSGGRFLEFYATHEIWLAVVNKRKSRKRVIGIDCKVKISKNKLTGKLREVEFPIYYDYGIDDIGSCIEFIIQEGGWERKKKTIITDLKDIKGEFSTIVDQIEKQNLEKRLRRKTAKIWLEIEESLKLNRKRKYE